MSSEPQWSKWKSLLSRAYSLQFKLAVWVSLALIITLGGSLYFNSQVQLERIEKSLSQKASSQGQFLALISPQAIYAFDFITLDRYVERITTDRDILFAAILNSEGNPMTTVLPSVENISEDLSARQKLKKMKALKNVVAYDFDVKDKETILGRVVIGVDSTYTKKVALHNIYKLVLGYALIIIFLAVLIYFILKFYVVRPVASLHEGAIRVSEGDLNTPIRVYSDDELGQLSLIFNRMMEEIRQDRAELLDANAKLETEISEHQKAEQELRKLSLAVEQSPASVVITDLDGVIEYVNPRFTDITGYSQEEVVGKSSNILNSGKQSAEYYQALWAALKKGDTWEGEFCNQRKDGTIYWEYATIAPIVQDDNRITHYLAVKEDITSRKDYEKRLLDQATHDDLTDLPNRVLAMDRLQQLIELAKRQSNMVIVVVFIDLDNFKFVNDTLGHAAGDSLLIEIAQRLSSVVRNNDTVARLGGDEFLVIMGIDESSTDNIPLMTEKLLHTIAKPVELHNRDFIPAASMGVSIFPSDGDTSSTLLKNADVAMYEAKREGKNRIHYFTQYLNQQAEQRMEMEHQLRRALQNQELVPRFQPLLDVSNNSLRGAELLLRWTNASLGDVSPVTFIPLAEEIGLIIEIESWAIEQAIAHAASWSKAVENDFYLSINISPLHFMSEHFTDTIHRMGDLAKKTDLSLIVEITEGILLKDLEIVQRRFGELKSLDIKIALDDFGTGYSSMAYIKKFSFDYLKIDRSFVKPLPHNTDSVVLCETMVYMAGKLGLMVVGEGVETEEQAKCLQKIGVNVHQGYLYGRPMHASKFTKWLSQRGGAKPQTLYV